MPAPTVLGSATTVTTAGSSTACNLPASVAGDLLLMFFAKDGNTAPPAGTPAGWTDVTRGHHNGGDVLVAWRIADGTEGPTVLVDYPAGNEASSVAVYRLSGHDPLVPPQIGAFVNSLGPTIDVPALAPTWGLGDVLWIAWANGWAPAVDSPPAGYTDALAVQSGASPDQSGQMTARKTSTAASEDPGTFGFASGRWIGAALVAVKGAASGGAGFVGSPGGELW